MKQNSKNENQICFILYLISSVLFAISGIMIIIDEGISRMSWITNIGLCITFGLLAIGYYKRYKSEK